MRMRVPFLVVLALFVAVSCDQQPVAPDTGQHDELAATFAHNGTPFAGKATVQCPPGSTPGTEQVLPTGQMLQMGRHIYYYFDASDPRVTGMGEWWTNKKIEADMSSAKIWGKIELVVDGGLGVWDLSFHGYRTGKSIVLEATGQGKEGSVKGLVGKWTLTMMAVPICQRVFTVTGDILE